MAPKASRIGVLTDPSYSSSKADVLEIEAAARAIGRPIVVVVTAYTEREFEPAFVRLVQAGVDALVVSGSPFFTSQHRQLAALASRYAIPAIYDQRDYVAAGGLGLIISPSVLARAHEVIQ